MREGREWNIGMTFSMTKAKAIVKYAFNHCGFEFREIMKRIGKLLT